MVIALFSQSFLNKPVLDNFRSYSRHFCTEMFLTGSESDQTLNVLSTSKDQRIMETEFLQLRASYI